MATVDYRLRPVNRNDEDERRRTALQKDHVEITTLTLLVNINVC